MVVWQLDCVVFVSKAPQQTNDYATHWDFSWKIALSAGNGSGNGNVSWIYGQLLITSGFDWSSMQNDRKLCQTHARPHTHAVKEKIVHYVGTYILHFSNSISTEQWYFDTSPRYNNEKWWCVSPLIICIQWSSFENSISEICLKVLRFLVFYLTSLGFVPIKCFMKWRGWTSNGWEKMRVYKCIQTQIELHSYKHV